MIRGLAFYAGSAEFLREAPPLNHRTLSVQHRMLRILEGMPPYGELPRSFPEDWGRLGRQGTVVEFTDDSARGWVANFRPGAGGATGVFEHPDGRSAVVVARGDLWMVDPEIRDAHFLIPCVEQVWPVTDPLGYVMSRQGLAFFRLDSLGISWHTRRISWDGFDLVRIGDCRVWGNAWNALDDAWMPFTVDLATGKATGGGYDGDDIEGWEHLGSTGIT